MMLKNMMNKIFSRLLIVFLLSGTTLLGMDHAWVGLNPADIPAANPDLNRGDDIQNLVNELGLDPGVMDQIEAALQEPHRALENRQAPVPVDAPNPVDMDQANALMAQLDAAARQAPRNPEAPAPLGNNPAIAPQAVIQPPVPQRSPAEQQMLQQLNNELAQNLDGLRGEVAAIEAEAGPLRVRLDAMLAQLDESDMGWFEEFRKEILFELPLGDSISLTLTGADLFKTIFLAAEAGCDHLLYKNLSEYYVKNALYNFATKKEMLVTLLTNAQDNNADSDAMETLIFEEFSTIFTFEKVLNSRLLLQIATHLLSGEMTKYFEHSVFPVHQGGVMSLCKGFAKQGQAAEERQRKNGGRFEITCYQILRHLSIFYHGGFPVLEENLPWLRRMLLRFNGWHHEAMDSYLFYLAKRSLALVRFLKQSNDFYTARCQEFYKKHSEKFCFLIAKMANTQDDAGVPKNAAEEELKALIKEAHDVAFLDWVRFKHSCCAWTDLWIESVLLLPIWYEAGKLAYRKMQ